MVPVTTALRYLVLGHIRVMIPAQSSLEHSSTRNLARPGLGERMPVSESRTEGSVTMSVRVPVSMSRERDCQCCWRKLTARRRPDAKVEPIRMTSRRA
ncbi:indole-3-acetic acid-amido synthetase GH3.8 [Iris pallida]|uniref:Indole-3-acetic acid-amido synthetase GH3.8 n=1 Tax=Iris pallida TaxID=29817 RepID=A0AAX6H3G8_IRIPA|nr:indole-3-acetic acid-amido synthetase GH3.8 [Iris pallida]